MANNNKLGESKAVEHCPLCGKKLTFFNVNFKKYQGKRMCSKCVLVGKDNPKSHIITETKAACQACSEIWYYGKKDKQEQFSNQYNNTCTKPALCCTCSPLALLIPDKKIIELNKCPKCGSRAVKTELVTHNV